MKKLMILAFVGSMLIGMVGCGKTLAELRTNGDAVVDNATGTATTLINTVGGIVKKFISVGFTVYDIGKSIVDDTKDNATVIGGIVTGAGNTPANP